MAWVYVLRGSCGRYYFGSTENLERRVAEHRRGSNHTTKRFGKPLETVATVEMATIRAARELERRLKRKKNPKAALTLIQNVDDH